MHPKYIVQVRLSGSDGKLDEEMTRPSLKGSRLGVRLESRLRNMPKATSSELERAGVNGNEFSEASHHRLQINNKRL